MNLSFVRASVAVLVIILAACTPSAEKSAVTEKKVKIGAVIPLTGKVASYGKALQEGFELALDTHREHYELIYEDSKGNPRDGISAIRKLIDVDNVAFVLGDATSGVCLAIAPIAEKNKKVMMIAIATSDAIKDSGDYIFRTAPANSKQAEKAYDFIVNKRKLSRIAVLSKQNTYGVNLSKKFIEFLSSDGKQPVLANSYQEGVTDFRSTLQKMKSQNVEAVFIPGNYEETAAILKQANELGMTTLFVGTDGAYSPKLKELAGADAIQNFYLTMMGVDESSSYYQEFFTRFKVKYGKDPDVFNAYGYESLSIMLAAKSENSDLKTALYSSSFDSLTGRFRFDKDGEAIRQYKIIKIGD